MINPLRNAIRELVFYGHIAAIKLRYKQIFKGLDELNGSIDPRYGGFYIQNHTTHIDPVFTAMPMKYMGDFHIWVSDFVYKIWYMQVFNKWMAHASFLKVPHDLRKACFEKPCADAQLKYDKEMNDLIQDTADLIYQRNNVMIHPSGHSKKDGHEVIHNKTGVFKVLEKCPEANIVLVRHSGLWGSHFSQAAKMNPSWKNENQFWNQTFFRIFLMITLNFVFFIPKREITIEYKLAPPDFPRQGTSDEINQYLEKFYNENWGPEGEPLNRVPDFFWQEPALKEFTEAITHKFS